MSLTAYLGLEASLQQNQMLMIFSVRAKYGCSIDPEKSILKSAAYMVSSMLAHLDTETLNQLWLELGRWDQTLLR